MKTLTKLRLLFEERNNEALLIYAAIILIGICMCVAIGWGF